MKSYQSLQFQLSPEDNSRLLKTLGTQNEILKHIEKKLSVVVNNRGFLFTVQGEKKAIEIAQTIIEKLYALAVKKQMIPMEEVHLMLYSETQDNASIKTKKHISVHLKHGLIQARNQNQALYLNRILAHDINFGIGPAWTGKTYLAVACAVNALEHEKVRRIILVRPAVEAGEKLGFLPGDLSQKVDPYLRPLYDALYEFLGCEKVNQLLETNTIEIAPLAYMRGRTLNDSFIILDESQNTTTEQMKMFLTRIGFGSKAVITGDITQIDLSHKKQSGLLQVIDVLKGIPDISFTLFNASDVVRHPLVQKIVEAYAASEQREFSK
ncbi:MAG: PhoH family protein [Gammaproteobacteria bacterium]|nr:PhoH family protein [Gammaproteobacteria bacterium]